MNSKANLYLKSTLLILAVVLSALPSLAQQVEEPSETEIETVRVNTKLVNVTASVIDASGHPVRVAQSDLRITASGIAQEIAYFEAAQPGAIAILVDVSSSMRNMKAKRVRKAVREFVSSSDPRNSYTLIVFNDGVKVLGTFTGDRGGLKEILRALEKQPLTGETALYDACVEASRVLNAIPERGKRALVIFTDGQDTKSSATQDELQRALDQVGGLVYVNILRHPLAYPSHYDTLPSGVYPLRWAEEEDREIALASERLSSVLNSRVSTFRTEDELFKLAAATGRELDVAVRLGFYPSGAAARPGSHELLIESLIKGTRVQSRNRYTISQTEVADASQD